MHLNEYLKPHGYNTADLAIAGIVVVLVLALFDLYICYRERRRFTEAQRNFVEYLKRLEERMDKLAIGQSPNSLSRRKRPGKS